MRKVPLVALSLACTTLYGSCDYWCLNQQITFLAEYAYLNRSGLRDFTLVKELEPPVPPSKIPEDEEVLDTHDVIERFGAQSAFRAGILYHFNACATLEGLYTYVMPWHASKTVTPGVGGLLHFPFKEKRVINGFVNAIKAEAEYHSFLQNAELNYWIHVTPQYVDYFSFSYGMGFRYILLRERFRLTYEKATTEAFTSVKTCNNLYGLQLEAMLEINPNHCWTWSFMVKTAAFVNQAKNHEAAHDVTSDIELPHFTKSQTTASGLIEGDAYLTYHWTPFFSMHAGYQGFLLTGVALAPAQRLLRSKNSAGIRDNSQIVINGFYAGLTLSF